MNISLLKQINESIINSKLLFEAIDALAPNEELLDTFSLLINETAESLLGRAFAQVQAGKPVSDDDANAVLGLYALGDPTMKTQIADQLGKLNKGGTPLLVALQLAGDDAGVTNILRQAGNTYAQNSGQGAPFQIKNMMLAGNVLDQNQRAALTKRLQLAQSSFRNAAAKMQAQQNSGKQGQPGQMPGQQTAQNKTPATPASKSPVQTSTTAPVRPMNMSGGSGTTSPAAAAGM